MRSKTRLIFATFGTIVIATIFLISQKKMETNSIKIAVQKDNTGQLPKIDPASVISGEQAILVMNMYLPLLTYNNHGELIPGVATSWTSNKNKISFKINSRLSSTGEKINAKTVSRSLKRQLILKTGTHGNLSHFINCEALDSIDSECLGINVVNENEIEFICKKDEYVKFFIPILASLDFYILPDSSYNHKTLAIEDYSNTSGAYYLNSQDNQHTLLRNNNFPLFERESFSKINLIDRSGKSTLELLLSKQVDFIPTMNGLYGEHAKILSDSGFSLHQSQLISLAIVYFSESGRKKLNPRQRIKFAKQFAKEYIAEYLDRGITLTNEFFPPQHLGHLSGDLKKKTEDEFKDAYELKLPNLTLTTNPSPTAVPRITNIANKLKNIEILKDNIDLTNNPFADKVDFAVYYTDIAFNEDISLIHYNIKTDAFSLKPEQAAEWFEKYFMTEDVAERAKLLQKLHFDTLMEAKIVPFGVMPYYAAGRADLELNQPTLTAETHLWKIRKR